MSHELRMTLDILDRGKPFSVELTLDPPDFFDETFGIGMNGLLGSREQIKVMTLDKQKFKLDILVTGGITYNFWFRLSSNNFPHLLPAGKGYKVTEYSIGRVTDLDIPEASDYYPE